MVRWGGLCLLMVELLGVMMGIIKHHQIFLSFIICDFDVVTLFFESCLLIIPLKIVGCCANVEGWGRAVVLIDSSFCQLF